LGLLLIGAMTCAIVSWDASKTRSAVYPGVHLLGIPVGGERPLDAMRRVSAATGGGSLANYQFTASTGQRRSREVERFEFRSGDLGVNFDVRSSVKRAYQVGRVGSPWQRLRERLSARLSGRYAVDPDLSYDPGRAGEAVGEIARKVDRQPEDARVEISGATATLVPHKEGLSVDCQGTLSNLSLALSTLTLDVAVALDRPLPDVLTSGAEESHELARGILAAPVVLKARLPEGVGKERTAEVEPAILGEALRVGKVPPRDGPFSGRLDLSVDEQTLLPETEAFLASLNKAPEDAWLRFVPGEGASVKVVTSKDGAEPAENPAAVLQKVSEGLLSEEHEFEVATARVEPDLTTEEAEKLKPAEPLAENSVSFEPGAADPGRLQNISAAREALDGTLLGPGESMSFLDSIAGLSFAASDPIVDAAADPERPPVDDAGGLSQVSTALYGAALKAGLSVTERNPSPTAAVPYVDGNLEAYVSPVGGEDLMIENTHEEYLLVRIQAPADGTVSVTIYGRPPTTPDSHTLLRAEREGVEESDGTIRETWSAYTVDSGGTEALGEHTYSYEDPTPPPPEESPEQSGEQGDKDPDETTPEEPTTDPADDEAPEDEPQPEGAPPEDGGQHGGDSDDSGVGDSVSPDGSGEAERSADTPLPGSEDGGFP
jgi:vancomycin resistance protein YoaR